VTRGKHELWSASPPLAAIFVSADKNPEDGIEAVSCIRLHERLVPQADRCMLKDLLNTG
jgi:hypothetical protein